MDHPLLSRRSHRAGPDVELTTGIRLPLARVHEACGRARRSFAMMIAARTSGHVYWIAPSWTPDQLNPEGMRRFVDPARFTHLGPTRPEDVLWCMEEILRSGTVPLVVADIPGLPGLTQVRRMHLAAERGLEEGMCQPLGLLLTPGQGGAQGVESRWRMEPRHDDTRELWRLERLRARTDPQRTWHITHGQQGFVPAPVPPWPVDTDHPQAAQDGYGAAQGIRRA
ncbi:MAG: hypothetical protein AAF891_04695 [Pseudomonadota bacterium]